MSAPRVLCFGEALWDLLPDGAVLGGAPLNLTYRLLSRGIDSGIISALGRDELGRKARDRMKKLGIDDRFVFENPDLSTGRVEIELSDNSEPSYTIVTDAAYDAVPLTPELAAASEIADCFCYGTLAQRDARSRSTLRTILESRRTKLNLADLNLRPECYDRDSVDYSLRFAGILKINEDEARLLNDWYGLGGTDLRELASALCRRFELEICILTMGPKGACVGDPGGPVCAEPSYDVPRVDPCGAGDAFTAAFLAAYLNGRTVTEACRLGNALGSAVTARRGALQPIPEGEAERLMDEAEPYEFKEDDFAV